MKRRLRFLPSAQLDLVRLDNFLAEKSPAAAVRAAHAISEAAMSLRDLSERARPAAVVGLRELLVPFGRGAYVIQYQVDPDTVVVLRIFHSLEDR